MLFQIEKSGGGNAAATFVISCFGKKYDAKLLLFCCSAQAIDLFLSFMAKLLLSGLCRKPPQVIPQNASAGSTEDQFPEKADS